VSVPDRVADLQLQLDSHQAQPARATQLMQPASGHMHVWHPHAPQVPLFVLGEDIHVAPKREKN